MPLLFTPAPLNHLPPPSRATSTILASQGDVALPASSRWRTYVPELPASIPVSRAHLHAVAAQAPRDASAFATLRAVYQLHHSKHYNLTCASFVVTLYDAAGKIRGTLRETFARDAHLATRWRWDVTTTARTYPHPKETFYRANMHPHPSSRTSFPFPTSKCLCSTCSGQYMASHRVCLGLATHTYAHGHLPQPPWLFTFVTLCSSPTMFTAAFPAASSLPTTLPAGSNSIYRYRTYWRRYVASCSFRCLH